MRAEIAPSALAIQPVDVDMADLIWMRGLTRR
jgi:hypothetical protein